MALKIKYQLEQAGWATVTAWNGRESAKLTVSYLHDTLADLINAAIRVRNGEKEVHVLLMDEPGEHLIVFRSEDGVTINFEIRWFEDWASWNFVPEQEYKKVLSGIDTTENFLEEVFKNAESLLADNGIAGYKQKWIEHDFPIDLFNTLKSMLKKN